MIRFETLWGYRPLAFSTLSGKMARHPVCVDGLGEARWDLLDLTRRFMQASALGRAVAAHCLARSMWGALKGSLRQHQAPHARAHFRFVRRGFQQLTTRPLASWARRHSHRRSHCSGFGRVSGLSDFLCRGTDLAVTFGHVRQDFMDVHRHGRLYSSCVHQPHPVREWLRSQEIEDG